MNIRLTSAIVLSALLILTGCGRQKDNKVIECSQDVIADLGGLKEADGPVSFKLVVLNNEKDTIYPLKTATSCSCLLAEADLKPVAPGEKLVIDATFNPFGLDGAVMKELQVLYAYSDYPARPYNYMSFLVKTRVEPAPESIREDYPYDFGNGLHLSNETLNFGSQQKGATEEFRLRVATSLNKKTEITLDIPEELSSILECRTIKLDAKGRDTVTVRMNIPQQGFEEGKTSFEIHPVINGKRCSKPLKINYLGND